ncbi:Sphingomyelin phosphodiesterase 2, neutral membrane (Neutral sphingomyelinase) [Terramyces sp. JEL0728]|nr:Sphingomyelin phosphodiesterase 2, neutral membrane (Neutral sphingomyelinase) [Terramyces sp. JEL0728]
MKFLTYNIYLRPPGIHSKGGDFKHQRLHKFLRRVSHYDVICLQECFGVLSSRQQTLLAAAKEEGFHYSVTSPSNYSNLQIDCGLVILSKYPFVETVFKCYGNGCHSDRFAAKGVLGACIEINNEKLWVFTTHTQASYQLWPELTDPAVMARTEQLRMLQEFIKGFKADRVLLAGDFNVNSFNENEELGEHGKEYLQMMGILNELGVKDTVLEMKGKHLHTTTRIHEQQNLDVKCLDYIFYKNVKPNTVEINEFRDGNECLSDHCGVELDFDL